MPGSEGSSPETEHGAPGLAERIEHWVVRILFLIMGAELVFALLEGQWLTAFLVALIIGITLVPVLFHVRVPVKLPAEFQIMAIVFVFASLFLGEIRAFYERVWWWDIALHATSGLLLGIVGFLLVYVLNESRRVDLYMRPGFVAFFAFLFAVSMGVIWEIFEFGMDQVFGMEMQKALIGDASGLTDTMWDLIVDTLGALTISLSGWWFMQRPEEGFIQLWIQKFIDRNPGLFRQ